jgi:hypothetical protein
MTETTWELMRRWKGKTKMFVTADKSVAEA